LPSSTAWRGRVLVERAEGLCSEASWLRACNEIDAFEPELTEAVIFVSKFWLASSADEQPRRFKEREEISYKQYKITDEGWQNRLNMRLPPATWSTTPRPTTRRGRSFLPKTSAPNTFRRSPLTRP
jgi:Polyphosphate kinase 2 (PPK2)